MPTYTQEPPGQLPSRKKRQPTDKPRSSKKKQPDKEQKPDEDEQPTEDPATAILKAQVESLDPEERDAFYARAWAYIAYLRARFILGLPIEDHRPKK
jgi:hypothetical protein